MTEPVITLKDATVTVGNQTEILKQLNLEIYPGDFITVLGTNGAGKSTLFNAISGDLALSSGAVYHQGKDITSLSS